MTRTLSPLLALLIPLSTLAQPPQAARGAGKILDIKYPASTAQGELQVAVTYTLWIPDGVSRLRGVIVHQHGAGTTASREGSTAAYDLHWQALARKWDCALLGPSYHVLTEKNDLTPGASELWFDPRRGSEKTFLKALGEFAIKSGHPELETVPWALWGHSGGGIWSDLLATMHPERVAAMWLRSGSVAMFRTHDEMVQPKVPVACYSIPIMLNPGVKEEKTFKPNPKGKEKGPWYGNLATFREYRAQGALIGFAPDPRTDHECGDSRYLAIPYLDACLAARLPDRGSKTQALKTMDTSKAWLAPLLGKDAVPAAEFKGNMQESVWLPNEAIAKAWMEYVRTGAVSDTTPPPPPFGVKVFPKGAKGELGAEIFWNAEADFESGIGSFVILRDGKELAKVPPKGVGRFGRPLFQSMTYHDTPAQPLPEMRYLDATAKAGAMHVYEVVTVNSVGLVSAPSVKARPYPRINMSTSYQVDPTWPERPKGIGWGPMTGVAVDPGDNVWVLARNDPPVQVYRPDGKFVKSWGTGLMESPHQLKLDAHGHVWLSDTGNHVVLECTPEGKVIRTLGTRGEAGSDERHFNRPTDMVVTPAGDVFVADGYGNARIVHFDKNGKFVGSWGKLGVEPGEFSLPHAIALDSRGRLYVADRNNARVQVFDQNGKFLDQWRDLVVPCAFWMTAHDELWVLGSSPMIWRAGDRVLGYPPVDQLFMKFDLSGKLLQLWSVPIGEDGKERPGDLNWAHGIAVDSRGNLYAVDVHGNRAQKFVASMPPQPRAR
jgi:DNA-binding beta-propeller fold protein YncE